jgi:hypothetical protein
MRGIMSKGLEKEAVLYDVVVAQINKQALRDLMLQLAHCITEEETNFIVRVIRSEDGTARANLTFDGGMGVTIPVTDQRVVIAWEEV